MWREKSIAGTVAKRSLAFSSRRSGLRVRKAHTPARAGCASVRDVRSTQGSGALLPCAQSDCQASHPSAAAAERAASLRVDHDRGRTQAVTATIRLVALKAQWTSMQG